MSLSHLVSMAAATARAVHGVAITYRRGEASAELVATVGRTARQQHEPSGAILRVETRDYLIAVADLVLDEELVEPAEGDRIEETAGHQIITYEVLPLEREPAARYSGPTRDVWRIHTKRI